jgi:hypothetical protein
VYNYLSLQGTCARRRTMRSVRYSSMLEISLHPKDLSDVSTTKAECTCRFSPCGKYFAYAISYLVGDHIPIYTDCLCLIPWYRETILPPCMFALRLTSSPLSQVTRAECENDQFPDQVKWIKSSAITWSADLKGFLYQV